MHDKFTFKVSFMECTYWIGSKSRYLHCSFRLTYNVIILWCIHIHSDILFGVRNTCSCSEGTLRFKVSRYGEGYFIGCDRHPKCKYEPIIPHYNLNELCYILHCHLLCVNKFRFISWLLMIIIVLITDLTTVGTLLAHCHSKRMKLSPPKKVQNLLHPGYLASCQILIKRYFSVYEIQILFANRPIVGYS